MRWGQACLCVSIAANMDKVPSGSLVYRCVLHIGSGYVCVCVCGRGGGDKAFDSGESRWIENQYK